MSEIAELLWERFISQRELAAISTKSLLTLPREKLQLAARLLGLPVEDLTKTVLAQRLQQVLVGLAAQSESEGGDAGEAVRSKYDLGAGDHERRPAQIPWSYGKDRITSMLVSPEALFTYWEVTDEGIERARRSLGEGGREAALHLRVHDITGRIFDGTNSLGHFDIRVERADRQWFIHIGKPGSSACIDLGLRSVKGAFARIARSSRVDFPRHGMAAPGPVQWLTVRSAEGGGPSLDGSAFKPWRDVPERGWSDTRKGIVTNVGTETQYREWSECSGGDWSTTGESAHWRGPIVRTSWESGPFSVPVEAPAALFESFEGPVTIVKEEGKTRVVYGPWQVIIRGLGGWAERRVLSTWRMFASWIVGEGFAKELRMRAGALAPGGSEALAASEWRYLFGSELRLKGASEVFFLGASELRLMGASERLFAAASEWRLRGASEIRLTGASERRFAGASERLQRGASEARLGGASEIRLAGASEWRLAGASERLQRGASESAPRHG
ncbi:MAG: DUF4912 domain-containing protein [Vicinamibacteria bacterium]|nr:DUF4912 domain-containing protein [Vicinamibacteria bacterium]